VLLPHDLIAFPSITLGAFLEGEAVIIGATVASTLGSFHTWTVFAAAVLGTLLGDTVAFILGRVFQRGTTATLFGRRLISDAAIDQAHRFFRSHGGKTVFLVRFAYGMRTAGYFLAGASHMPYRRFFIADVLATILWVSLLVTLGLVLGKSILPYLTGWVGLIVGVVTVLLVASILVTLQRRVAPSLLSPPPK